MTLTCITTEIWVFNLIRNGDREKDFRHLFFEKMIPKNFSERLRISL